jgi:hypothetical protein
LNCKCFLLFNLLYEDDDGEEEEDDEMDWELDREDRVLGSDEVDDEFESVGEKRKRGEDDTCKRGPLRASNVLFFFFFFG